MKVAIKQMTWGLRIAAVVSLALATQFAVAAIGTIVGSKHDFSASGPNATYKGTSTQVCIYCHAPHANPGTTPLWNHATSAATYTLYSSSTMQATVGQPGGVSKLCMSCHDGTVAVDSFGGATGTKMATGTALLGTDLSNDHPIGITYNTALATSDAALADPSVKSVTIGSAGTNTGTIASKLLFGGQMECASCHDVHNSTAGTAVESKLVRITTAGSALCIACHNK